MGRVIVKGFLSDEEVNQLNRGGGFRILTGANLNPEYIKQLKRKQNKQKPPKEKNKFINSTH